MVLHSLGDCDFDICHFFYINFIAFQYLTKHLEERRYLLYCDINLFIYLIKSINDVVGVVDQDPPPPQFISCVEVLSTSEYNLFGERVFIEVIKLKEGHHCESQPYITSVLIKRGHLNTDMDTRIVPHQVEDKNW